MATTVVTRSPTLSLNGRNLVPVRSQIQIVDKAPADASAIISSINKKQTDNEYKLEGIILYICKNYPKCRALWAITWVEKPKCPPHLIKFAKYKELAVRKACADCELAEWELVDEAQAEDEDEAEEWVGA
ncbi:hypothetical protein AYL99_07885 [Fonsecaea erecta]|uniref:Uncharacterized protein n=1 Tax=Fonsecaea erecta TaxID=1367422 RepID=A0A178ZBK8_9EURO|nr:hypothetical protein AYL99_07885 [Fonsecaea erecta]OAP57148.1 hypothetical protein AYL99_07885 [Fonsecaea erecta]